MNQKRRGGPIASIPVIGAWAVLALAPTPTRCVGGEMEDKFEAARESGLQDLATQLISAEVANELNALPALASEDRVERLAEFQHHAHNASRLNHTKQTTPDLHNLARLSAKTQATIVQALNEYMRSNRSDPRFNVLSRINEPQTCALLESLEQQGEFESAATLAKVMLSGKRNSDDADLLKLIAGRCEWISNSHDENPDFTLLDEAITSQNEIISRNARLFKAAATTPTDYESLILAHRVWETLYLDNAMRGRGGEICRKITKQAAIVATDVANDAKLDPTLREFRLGRIASVASEAAFQRGQDEVLQWSVGVASTLTQADPEDKLTPAYFHAYKIFSRNRFAEAAQEFEPLFLSGFQCDIAADAGRMLANCYRHTENDIAFAATVNLLFEIYPKQTYILNQTQSWRVEAQRMETDVAAAVHQFIETHYREQIKKALAVNAVPAKNIASQPDGKSIVAK